MKPIVTILMPNYKTPDITKLCIRLIRKFTDMDRIRMIVIDNDSRDASTEYLRSLDWITLIERKPEHDDKPALSHSRALDLAFEQVDTRYVLSFHTDTFVRRKDWLDYLLKQIDKDPDIGGVGSWKLELEPVYKLLGKRLETKVQSLRNAVIRINREPGEDSKTRTKYLRSHCALYRTDLLRKYNLAFSADKNTAGKVLHEKLVHHGYKMVFLPPEILMKYIVHLNHATMVLNPELGSRSRTIRKGLRRMRKIFKELQAEEILKNDRFDVL